MEINALQAFIEVANSGSFSEAASRLFITQPAVSKRIATLEQELDTRLFDRIGRGISLTDTGKALLPRARNLINEAEEMKRLAHSLTGEVSGTLSVATSHHVGLHRLPPVLKQFVRQYPQVKLDMRFMDSEVACRSVESGELELAIVTLPAMEPPNLSMSVVWEDRLLPVIAGDHPLAKMGTITLEELLTYPAVLPGTATYTRSILDIAVAKAGLKLNLALATNYLETLKMLAEAGLGWSLLPHTMLDSTLVALEVTELKLGRQLGVVIHKDRTLSNAAKRMIELCR